MSKRIILLIASLAVVIGLMASSGSYAWFASSIQKGQRITVAVVNDINSANISDLTAPNNTIIMQGDNLITLGGRSAALELKNNSTAASQLRIAVEYTSYRFGSAEQVIYSDSADDDITVDFADGKWAKNINAAGVCYYYYMGDGYWSETVDNLADVPSLLPETGTVQAITDIHYNDDISYAYSGQDINVKVIFESKQADNITWSAIDSYDISGITE